MVAVKSHRVRQGGKFFNQITAHLPAGLRLKDSLYAIRPRGAEKGGRFKKCALDCGGESGIRVVSEIVGIDTVRQV